MEIQQLEIQITETESELKKLKEKYQNLLHQHLLESTNLNIGDVVGSPLITGKYLIVSHFNGYYQTVQLDKNWRPTTTSGITIGVNNFKNYNKTEHQL